MNLKLEDVEKRAAYVPSKRAFKQILKTADCPTIDILASRYDGVVLMTSLAVDQPEAYERLKDTNAARFETREEAALANAKTAEAWSCSSRNS